MRSPKLSGRRIQFGPTDVGMGSLRLPGARCLREPSAMMTERRVRVEMMPMIEVMDKKRRGTNVVGKILDSAVRVRVRLV